ncbi:MAG: acetyl-coenzyme A synthetase N-terminal domain-containing protein, partial [Vicinamibacterales bacterium]|nr:acetyl-coenzyme A synthetase N-terminal domain-containing protein [Vicinamibacterales bacterium]
MNEASNPKIYPPSNDFVAKAHVDAETYETMYKASIEDPESFWGEQAKTRLDWIEPFTKVKDADFTLGKVKIKW